MQDLQLIGVHEDGEHLLLSGPEGERFQLPLDDALRAAIRRDRPHLGQLQIEVDGGLRPRDVQALIRAGSSSDEAARRAGWPVEKVHRYEGPILAEREHVAGLAQQARLRPHGSASGGGVSGGATAPTLSARVTERLRARDVEVTDASWDSWRTESGPWTVVLTFAAGGRQRQASWSFDLADRTVSAVDDEARWLSEEVQEAKGPIPAPRQRPSSVRDTAVYDVEAEGGLRPPAQDKNQDENPDENPDDPLDLMTAMRKRSTARGRRTPGVRRASGRSVARPPARVPDPDPDTRDRSLPLAELDYEPETISAQPAGGRSEVTDDDDSGLDDSSTQRTSAPAGDPARSGVSAEEHQAPEKSGRRGQSKARPKRPAGEAARKTGRPSVPAWDEIMFGSRPGADR
jgi:Protein of unknown function (DUF3071)